MKQCDIIAGQFTGTGGCQRSVAGDVQYSIRANHGGLCGDIGLRGIGLQVQGIVGIQSATNTDVAAVSHGQFAATTVTNH
ncbi:hypothetical protein D3C81_1901050 [compost metagenome]